MSSRRQTMKALLEAPSEPDVGSLLQQRVPSGAVRAVGLTLDRLKEAAGETSLLREQLASVEGVRPLDPSLVDASFVDDRLGGSREAGLSELVESIAAHGQQVPILVRPHSDVPGRFQAAYGHRRVLAARKLGVSVMAVVKTLSDADLVVAQGKENLERRDLTFIERVAFSMRLTDRGFDRATVRAALNIHDTELARFITIGRTVPLEVIEAIGPAPKVGRPRWLQLANLLEPEGSRERAQRAISDTGFGALSSELRFKRVFDQLSGPESDDRQEAWHDPQGRLVVQIERVRTATRLTFNERTAPSFASFLIGKLDELHAEYSRRSE